MKHIFDQGKAIIITGREGVGKSTLARVIADNLGGAVVVQQMEAFSCSHFNSAWTSAETVVVEGFDPEVPADIACAKSMASQNEVVVLKKGAQDRTIKMPNFIFVTGNAEPFAPGLEGRRFLVVNLS